MSLDELQAKQAQYFSVKNQASAACGPASSLRSELIATASVFAENVILNGKPFDQGKLEEYASKLGGVYDNLQSIISICNSKIDELQIKIDEEKARLARLAAQASTQTSTSSTTSSSSTMPSSSTRDSGLPSVLRM